MDERFLAYMRAWIRLHCQAEPNLWRDREVAEAFLLLPPCPVSFGDWLKALGVEEEEKQPPNTLSGGALAAMIAGGATLEKVHDAEGSKQ